MMHTIKSVVWYRFDRTLLVVAIVAAVVASAICLTGCESGGADVPQVQASLERSRADLARLKAENQAALVDANVKGDLNAAEKARKSLDVIEKSEKAAQAASDAVGAIGGDPAATQRLSALTSLLPPPFNVIGGIGVPLALLGLQQLRVRRASKAAESIVKGIEEVKGATPAVAEALEANKIALNAAYTPLAKRIVKKHKKTKSS